MGGVADVVEFLFGEQGIPGVELVTTGAAPLAVEQRPATLGGVVDGMRVAGEKAVEGRIAGVERALEGGDRRGQVIIGGVPAVDRFEGLRIFRNAPHATDNIPPTLLPHLPPI